MSCSIAKFGFCCQTYGLQDKVQQQRLHAFQISCTINFHWNYTGNTKLYAPSAVGKQEKDGMHAMLHVEFEKLKHKAIHCTSS